MKPSMLTLFDELVAAGWSGIDRWVAEGPEESITLEFKRKETPAQPMLEPEDKEALAKSISGLANIEGGIIGFGLWAEGKGKAPDRLKSYVRIENLDRVALEVERWAKQLTDPPVAGVRVASIEDQANKGQGVILLYVPQSRGGPHRVVNASSETNDRYYMRTANASVTIPHRLLAALFGQWPPPVLQLRVRTEARNVGGPIVIAISMCVRNIGRGAARQPALKVVEIDKPGLQAVWWNTLSRPTRREWDAKRATREQSSIASLRSTAESVIYPGDEIEIFEGVIGNHTDCNWDRGTAFDFDGAVYCLNAQPVEFKETLIPESYPTSGDAKTTEWLLPSDEALVDLT